MITIHVDAVHIHIHQTFSPELDQALRRTDDKLTGLDEKLVASAAREEQMAVTAAQVKELLERTVTSNAELRKDVQDLVGKIQNSAHPEILSQADYDRFNADVTAAEELGRDTDAALVEPGGGTPVPAPPPVNEV